MSALGSCLQMLGLNDEPGRTNKALRIARRSVDALDEMVTNLLEYTRSRLGRGLEVQPAPGDFAALCQQAFDEVCAAYPKRDLQCEIPGDVPLAFDAARMRQVLSNLLGNAVHHGDAAFPVFLVVRDDGPDETEHGLTPRIADLKVNSKPNEINDLPRPPPRQCWVCVPPVIALKTRGPLG